MIDTNPSSDKIFIEVLKGKVTKRPPFWLMRQAGRYLPEYRELRKRAKNFLDFCYRPDLAVEATLQPLRRFAPDAAILFADILLIPDALGQYLVYREGEGPVLDPIRSGKDVARLTSDRIDQHLAPVYETVARLRREIPPTTALIGFAGSPWTVATYMVEGGGSRDHAIVKRWAISDPDEFQHLIDLIVAATIDYANQQIAAGAEAFQLFDTWAGVLPEREFHRWCIEPTRRIVEAIRETRPDVPIIAFPRGAGIGYETFVKAVVPDAVSLDNTMALAWARDHLQPLCAVQGNLDPQYLVAGGAAMSAEIERICDCFGSGPFIFNLGHGIVPNTPPEHVVSLADQIRGR